MGGCGAPETTSMGPPGLPGETAAPSLGVGLRREFYSQRLHNGNCRLQGRIAVCAERAIELLTRQSGIPGNLCHPLGTSNDTEGMSDIAGIFRLEGFLHKYGNRFVRWQILGRVISR